MNLSRWLADELAKGEIFNVPAEPIQDGDVLVGELPKDLRPFYALVAKLNMDAAKKTDALYKKRDVEAKKDRPDMAVLRGIKREIVGHLSLSNAVTGLFWASVRQTFPDALDGDLISLKEGWQVVTSANKGSDSAKTIGGLVIVFG